MNGAKYLAISFGLLAFLIFILMKSNSSTNSNHTSNTSLTVFCAAGIRLPYEEIAKSFEKEYGIQINTEYRGSGHLLVSIEQQPGDLFIVADESYTNIAIKKGLVKETLPLAIQYPVIVTQKGNPKNIQTLEDLIKPTTSVSAADPKAASIGKIIQNVYSQLNQWDSFLKNTTEHGTFKPTVTEVANDLKMRSVDAAIIWNALPKQKAYEEHFESIEDERLKTFQEKITVGILSKSKQPTLALKFARYLHAKEKGQVIFTAHHYKPIEDADSWSETPEINLMSGGVNRLAIEETLNEFEKREGIKIVTTYNGCGILVGQMKAGQRPDAYFACDISFTNQVSDLFKKGENISSTNIVVAVPIENKNNIATIKDLTKPNIRIGIGHPQQSALGALTKNILVSMNLYDEISKNVVSEQPGADMVVAQLVSGSIDAALVYRVNISKVLDKVAYFAIDNPEAKAIQPFSIANKSHNTYATERLLKAIKNHGNRFEKNGFSFLLNAETDK